MKQGIFEITENSALTENVLKMTLSGDVSEIKKSGQFINISIEGLFLRRPISVYDKTDKTVTVIYKVVGEGTERMSKMKPGDKLDVLTGLGNGFSSAVYRTRPEKSNNSRKADNADERGTGTKIRNKNRHRQRRLLFVRSIP